MNYIIHDAGIELLLTQSALLDKFRFSSCLCISIDESYAHLSTEAPTHLATLNNTAYLIYTSGSTGQPKGVLVSHRNLLHSTLARTRYYHDSLDCFLLLSSFAFDSSVAGIFWTLSEGARLCLPKSDDATNPATLAELIHRHQVSHILTLPSFYKVIVSDSNVPLLSSLKTVIVAGEACTVDMTAEHHRKLPNVKFFNEYGPTEATVWSSVYESTREEIDNVVPIGRAFENVQIYILDKQCQPVPIGVNGELYIGGTGLAQGYLNQSGLTAEKFIPNPFGTSGQRLYKTGDLGRYRIDGNIEFLGRIDQQVKIRGYRIELGEIEAHLAAFHSINEAVVSVREDQPGNKRLVAYLTVNYNQDVAVADLRSHLLAVLPEYRVPSAFVVLEDFPLTANGKLDRRSLPDPDMDALVTQQYEAPEGAVEVLLAQIWQELLGIEQVGRYDNFFELGGHSLIVITLIERLQKQGLSVDVQIVFAAPVLAEMAETISQSDDTLFIVPTNKIPSYCTAITPDMLPLVSLSQNEINSIVVNVAEGATNIQDIYPLAPLQQGILFHHLLEVKSDAYLKRSILSFDSRSY
ncbi:MAG: amino acid adenylation domain-containing protein, partial [Novosphingobium sp.]